jgi:hypothetical protein
MTVGKTGDAATESYRPFDEVAGGRGREDELCIFRVDKVIG